MLCQRGFSILSREGGNQAITADCIDFSITALTIVIVIKIQVLFTILRPYFSNYSHLFLVNISSRIQDTRTPSPTLNYKGKFSIEILCNLNVNIIRLQVAMKKTCTILFDKISKTFNELLHKSKSLNFWKVPNS